MPHHWMLWKVARAKNCYILWLFSQITRIRMAIIWQPLTLIRQVALIAKSFIELIPRPKATSCTTADGTHARAALSWKIALEMCRSVINWFVHHSIRTISTFLIWAKMNENQFYITQLTAMYCWSMMWVLRTLHTVCTMERCSFRQWATEMTMQKANLFNLTANSIALARGHVETNDPIVATISGINHRLIYLLHLNGVINFF